MFDSLKALIEGDLLTDSKTLSFYSHDASLIEIRPQAVVFPKSVRDVEAVIEWVNVRKEKYPELSITARSAGTCMSGGSVNDSIILDFTKYMGSIIEMTDDYGVVEPGCFYRDFETQTSKRGRMMPSFTASKDICAVGGMFGNNSGGEKTLRYGKVEDYVLETQHVFSDGNTYRVKALSRSELNAKIAQKDFEGTVYRRLFHLIDTHYEQIQSAKPSVSKNSAGYYLWNVWDKKTGIFDLNRLLVGSQGTLGVMVEQTWKLVPRHSKDTMVVIFLDELDSLGELVAEILEFEPDSLESYDDESAKLAVKFFKDFFKQLGFFQTLDLMVRFIPEAIMMLRGGFPKLVLIAEFTGDNQQELSRKAHLLQDKIKHFGYEMRIPRTDADEQKYWKIRHESFNMLRKHVRGLRTAPFIDDFCVAPKHLAEFLPKMNALLAEYPSLVYTIAGHAGNGNFHIIPLMDMTLEKNRTIVGELSEKVYDLVLSYGGSITAEHNDGIIRTPYLEKMYGKEVCNLFKEVKNIFDPQGILNPRKKVGATKQYMLDHLSRSNTHS